VAETTRIDMDDTLIGGTTPITLKAADGTVVFGYNEIASEDGATLNVTGTAATAAIAVRQATGAALADERILKLSGVNLNLTGGGSLTLIDPNASGNHQGKVVLLNKAQLTLDNTSSKIEAAVTTNARTNLQSNAIRASFSGIGAVVLVQKDASPSALYVLGDNGAGTLTITGPRFNAGSDIFRFQKSGVSLVN
jgi:hypothetical protein